ncbi:DUF1707 SHOCT-like domain-containing protein [Kutzneria sp. CA-103260]|uniref:DUF1707 SHOCT-like domain-containing protein n=1 Tax=Kutzneria sp. CA-103260 TaxID=2802641 RepID=UPI003FA61118
MWVSGKLLLVVALGGGHGAGGRLVADAERERALRLLEMAVGHGMLSVEEFTASNDLVLAAATVSDLEAV